MRVIVQNEVVSKSIKDELKIKIGEKHLIPLRKLNYSGYPACINCKYLDYLWMIYEKEDEWNNILIHMTSRLRRSSHDKDEFLQAAATQVVFHECAAIYNSLKTGSGKPSSRNK